MPNDQERRNERLSGKEDEQPSVLVFIHEHDRFMQYDPKEFDSAGRTVRRKY